MKSGACLCLSRANSIRKHERSGLKACVIMTRWKRQSPSSAHIAFMLWWPSCLQCHGRSPYLAAPLRHDIYDRRTSPRPCRRHEMLSVIDGMKAPRFKEAPAGPVSLPKHISPIVLMRHSRKRKSAIEIFICLYSIWYFYHNHWQMISQKWIICQHRRVHQFWRTRL